MTKRNNWLKLLLNLNLWFPFSRSAKWAPWRKRGKFSWRVSRNYKNWTLINFSSTLRETRLSLMSLILRLCNPKRLLLLKLSPKYILVSLNRIGHHWTSLALEERPVLYSTLAHPGPSVTVRQSVCPTMILHSIKMTSGRSMNTARWFRIRTTWIMMKWISRLTVKRK